MASFLVLCHELSIIIASGAICALAAFLVVRRLTGSVGQLQRQMEVQQRDTAMVSEMLRTTPDDTQLFLNPINLKDNDGERK